MRCLVFVLPLLMLGCTDPLSLRVVEVERPGMPPFPPGERIYRLAGIGAERLRHGDRIDLEREDSGAFTGRVEVVGFRRGAVLARLVTPGETFPLLGDVAQRLDFKPLPETPQWLAEEVKWPAEAWLHPRPVALPEGPTRREPLYFLPGDPALSPAGIEKLAGWVKAWGTFGSWTLEYPEQAGLDPGLIRARTEGLRTRLGTLGIPRVRVRACGPQPPERFDVVYVVVEPW